MVTISQVQHGFIRFVNNEVVSAFSGWQRIVVAGTADLLASNLNNVIASYGSHPLVSALGVYDQQDGVIDVDKLYNAYVPQMGTDKIPITIPKIATIKMGKEEIDLLIVPGVAFTREGKRMGYGGGYYDRFIPLCTNARIIALAFSEQLVDFLPTEAHDLPIPELITPLT